ncbi:unnamed protein product [Fusarium venenatum]|uniref:Uncharacterized protein n=1 Tax=Fusarium venenatum TaxID=56646 RepID=A0A2L2TW99_9HYPO|nr:uncharacterized protein FVRRES_10274 [Fusarium venenatum]CEI70197.1 unnamed protein product [Fusarium venenatum]
MSQTDSAMDDGTDADWLSVRLDGPRGTGSTLDGDEIERRESQTSALTLRKAKKDQVEGKAALDFHVEAQSCPHPPSSCIFPHGSAFLPEKLGRVDKRRRGDDLRWSR